jgi:nucleotide-binding universal stress UspA family protein
MSPVAPPPTAPAPAARPPVGELRFHRLLVALDGSANADLALWAAVTAARRDHAALTLITVVPDAMAETARWAAFTGVCAAQLQDDADQAAIAILQDALRRIPSDIPVTTVLRHGKAGPEIVAFARAGTYDAILLGARGVGRVGALVGSVSSHVLHHAEIAVFVAHAPRPEPEEGAGR